MRKEELPESLSEGPRSGGFEGVNPLATDVLRRNGLKSWTKPAPTLYPHQWSWDSAFIALGLAHVDNRRATDELETLFTGQWSTGKVPHIVFNPRPHPKATSPTRSAGTPPRSQNMRPQVREPAVCSLPVHAIVQSDESGRPRGARMKSASPAPVPSSAAITGACSPGTATWLPPAIPKAPDW